MRHLSKFSNFYAWDFSRIKLWNQTGRGFLIKSIYQFNVSWKTRIYTTNLIFNIVTLFYKYGSYLTNAFAAVSLLQIKTWHSSTFIPVVLRRMAANSGGWFMLGFRANGLSRGKNLGWADLSEAFTPEADRLRVLLFELVPFPVWPFAALPGTNTYLTAAQ